MSKIDLEILDDYNELVIENSKDYVKYVKFNDEWFKIIKLEEENYGTIKEKI